MGNAIKYIKHEITHEIRPEMPEDEVRVMQEIDLFWRMMLFFLQAKQYLCDSIDNFVHERIVLAQVRLIAIVMRICHNILYENEHKSCRLF